MNKYVLNIMEINLCMSAQYLKALKKKASNKLLI